MPKPAKVRPIAYIGEDFWSFVFLAVSLTLCCLYTARNVWVLFGEGDPMCTDYYASKPCGGIETINVPAILWCYLSYIFQFFAAAVTANTMCFVVWAWRQPDNTDFRFGLSPADQIKADEWDANQLGRAKERRRELRARKAL